MMTKKAEFEEKLKRVRYFMNDNNFQGVLFSTDHNFSWLTCGGDDILIHSGSEENFMNLLVTEDNVYLLTNNVEMPRVVEEELGELEIEKVEYLWYQDKRFEIISEILGGGKLASDRPFPGAEYVEDKLKLLRVPLLEPEVSRFRVLGQMSSTALESTMLDIKPGMSEFEIHSIYASKLLENGIFPVALMVGTDERILNFRHPVSTSKKLQRYCLILTCARKYGLIVSLTRLCYFGKLPKEINERYSALKKVEMSYITATKDGNTLAEVYKMGQKAYKSAGYEGEEMKHFQGGTCGYLTREQDLNPLNDYTVVDGEVFAHNPTILGTKLEDTIYLKNGNYEVLTKPLVWPVREVEYNGIVIKRPEIMVR